MEDIAALSKEFQDSLASNEPVLFNRAGVIEQLSDDDRHALAQLILNDIEKTLSATGELETVIRALAFAEELAPASSEIFCRGGLILFRLGLMIQTNRAALVWRGLCLILALDKITHAELINPDFFSRKSEWFHLWGNILVDLYLTIGDETYLVNGLSKFEKAIVQPNMPVIAPMCRYLWIN